jgi:hypothetical protein
MPAAMIRQAMMLADFFRVMAVISSGNRLQFGHKILTI